MKIIQIIIIFTIMTTGFSVTPESFATSENFYSIEYDTGNIVTVSNQEYGNQMQDSVTATISNGNITKFDFSFGSQVMIHVNMQEDGLLYVNIPKSIMYLADHNCNSDGIILVEGEEVQNLSEEYPLQHNLISYNVKSWAIEVPQDSKQVEIVFAFIIPDAPHSYAFGQRCLMMERGEFMKPLIQANLGLELYQITCRDGFELTYKKESRPACVTDDTFIKLFERGWQPRLFLPQDIIVPELGHINYNIVGDMRVTDIVGHPESGITEIFLDAKNKSNLVMTLEREFLGMPFQEGSSSPGYIILVDGNNAKFGEPWEKNSYRIYFQLNVPSGTEKIEVVSDK